MGVLHAFWGPCQRVRPFFRIDPSLALPPGAAPVAGSGGRGETREFERPTRQQHHWSRVGSTTVDERTIGSRPRALCTSRVPSFDKVGRAGTTRCPGREARGGSRPWDTIHWPGWTTRHRWADKNGSNNW
eukprot:scaffold798_cov367-Pavlova_lutheri.AAC.18